VGGKCGGGRGSEVRGKGRWGIGCEYMGRKWMKMGRKK
jgi:hypothetical protein